MASSSRRFAVFFALLVAACGARDGAPPERAATMADTCRIQLAPRNAALELPAATPAAPSVPHASRLIANVDMKLGPIAAELEHKVTTRLAEEKNRNVGMAGRLEYTVDRGPMSVAVEGDALVIRTDVRGHAQVCRGSSCYASCDPQGRATATVPLRLTPDYRFAPSHVSFAFTRRCEVKALGFIKIDVTDAIQGQLAPALRRVEQEIDGKLPPVKTQAERLWAELGKSRPIPLGGCFVGHPRGIVEGPLSAPDPGTARVRMAIAAYPELRSRCGEPEAPHALPPLVQDPNLPADDDLVLALVTPLAVAAAGLEASDPFDAGGAKARIARAVATSSGAAAQFDLGLRGEACGELGVLSALGWTEDGRALRLSAPIFTKGERERAQASTLAPDVFVRSVGSVRFAPPLAPDALKDLLPTVASSMSDGTVDVAAHVEGVKPLDVTLRGDDVAAAVLMRGRVDLKQR
jgi:hypothetical protein